MATLPTEASLTGATTTNAQQKVNLAGLRNYVADDVAKRDGSQAMTGQLKYANAVSIASAATVDLTTAGSNLVTITGTATISAWTMTDGQVLDVVFSGAGQLTHNATTNNLPGGANLVRAAEDRATLMRVGTTVYVRLDGASSFGAPQTWQTVTRALLTTYTNTTGRTIIGSVKLVMIPGSTVSLRITAPGGSPIEVASIENYTGGTFVTTLFYEAQNGEAYYFGAAGGSSIDYAKERR